jgi:hypothetical protein
MFGVVPKVMRQTEPYDENNLQLGHALFADEDATVDLNYKRHGDNRMKNFWSLSFAWRRHIDTSLAKYGSVKMILQMCFYPHFDLVGGSIKRKAINCTCI